MSLGTFLSLAAFALSKVPARERAYVLAYLRIVAAGVNPIQAARNLALAYGGERAVDEAAKELLK